MSKKAIGLKIAYIVLFVIFIGKVLSTANKIVCAKFIGDSTTIVDGFYAEKRNDIDMIVLGSSNSFCTVDPLVLYEEYGIAAYDFGSSSQPMNISVLYLKEALKKQKPKVVAFEINMITSDRFSSRDESGLRWGLTNMPFSMDKLECIYQSVEVVNDEFFSYVFPIFRYHNRWKELSAIDYTYFYRDKTNYTKGYLETQAVSETVVNLTGYNFEGDAWFEEANIAYLDEMAQLCRKKNVELLLFKSPKEGWHKYETEAVRALAEERGLKFVDFNELYSDGKIELDMASDFRDALHLNDFGARKVTSYLGRYLKENYELPDRRNGEKANSWDVACAHRQRKGWQDYMAAKTAKECIEMLQDDKDYVLIVTDAKNGGMVRQWVYQDCNIALDIRWQENGMRHFRIGDGELVLSRNGSICQILIDGVENYQAGSRWNIIVYDKILNCVTANLVYDE
ncbi:MAG: SGNH/GDSL hydrolase family protein [Lachnospiraceae bacterium]|nr:SGNH/GDSL hydrolase family protein [Lachnospiraceae bacterium]